MTTAIKKQTRVNKQYQFICKCTKLKGTFPDDTKVSYAKKTTDNAFEFSVVQRAILTILLVTISLALYALHNHRSTPDRDDTSKTTGAR